jgi:mannose-1-phosphate guanylyltransferase/mannose-1-phosphate guanylyltransferase/phosphomannomutase
MTHAAPARAMVLAAGKGTRLQGAAPELAALPKPLIPLAGKPVLERNLELCAQHGVREVAINLHRGPEAVRELVGDGSRWGLRVRYSYEPELLGTAGGVRRMAGFLGESSFLVLYGDNYTDCDLTTLLAEHEAARAVATVAVFDTRAGLHSGIAGSRVVIADDGAVAGFEETRGAEGTLQSPWTNAGVYALDPAVFELIPPEQVWDFGRDVFPALLDMPGRLRAYRHPGFCYALDTPEAYRAAEERLRGAG